LLAILIPSLTKAKDQARLLISMSRQKQVTASLAVYAFDSEEGFPPSVATIGTGDWWNWSDPRMLTAKDQAFPGTHRAMGEYLRHYIENVWSLYCPTSPNKYVYLQEAWDAGDTWDNPNNPFPQDPVTGTFCCYWNYVGYLGEGPRLFVGPGKTTDGRGRSRLLISDYFGFDHYRSPGAYGSCKRTAKSYLSRPEKLLSADFWCWSQQGDAPLPSIRLHAGYVDGHVERYLPEETLPMRVILNRSTSGPYPDGIGPGTFHLPDGATR
jgi:hypothetical protein